MADEWIGAELPGAVPELRIDAGGERWWLDGQPLHAGDPVEVLAEAERRWCGPCEAEGRIGGARCPSCAGRGYQLRPTWWRGRWEYDNAGDGTGCGLLYLRIVGAERHHAIPVRAGDLVRCRRVPHGR